MQELEGLVKRYRSRIAALKAPVATRADIVRAVKDVRAAETLELAVELAIRLLISRPPHQRVATRDGCARGEFGIAVNGMTVFCHANSETDGDAESVVAAINGEAADV